MDEFEKKFFSTPFGFFDTNVLDEFKTDIKDEGDRYELEADLPGFDKKDIHLDINGDMLTVSAERHSEHEEKDKKNKYVRCERSYGSYSRSFDVSAIQQDKIRASYKDGVLELTLPKKNSAMPDRPRLPMTMASACLSLLSSIIRSEAWPTSMR
mgnify:CR=1 FL=1